VHGSARLLRRLQLVPVRGVQSGCRAHDKDSCLTLRSAMAEKIAATALKTTGVAVRRGFGIASAQIGAQDATARTKTDGHTLSNDGASEPLLGTDTVDGAADGQTSGHLTREVNQAAAKPKPKPKPNPKQVLEGNSEAGLDATEEEQIRLIDEAARTQTAGSTDDKDGEDEDAAYKKWVAAHPEWYQTMPDDANIFQQMLSGPMSVWLYFKRMTDNFGFGYLCAVIFTYGLNQGTGNAFYNFATMFYFVDVLQVAPARFAEFQGLAHVPWDIKAFFGMISDMWPICGYRLSPYIIMSAASGTIASSMLAFFPVPAVPAAFCLLFINFGIAIPDVMIDGSIALRMKSHPAMASDLQTLCWMSVGMFGMMAALIQGPIIDNFGPQALYKMAILPIGAVVIPAVFGWLREERLPPGQRNPKCSVCAERLRDEQQAPIFRMAIYLGFTALGLGLMSTFLTEESNPWNDVIPAEMIKASVVLTSAVLIGVLIWCNLGKVGDGTGNLGKCAMYMYLRAATTPGASVMFYWVRLHALQVSFASFRLLAVCSCHHAHYVPRIGNTALALLRVAAGTLRRACSFTQMTHTTRAGRLTSSTTRAARRFGSPAPVGRRRASPRLSARSSLQSGMVGARRKIARTVCRGMTARVGRRSVSRAVRGNGPVSPRRSWATFRSQDMLC
jgi:hypothetical protein